MIFLTYDLHNLQLIYLTKNESDETPLQKVKIVLRKKRKILSSKFLMLLIKRCVFVNNVLIFDMFTQGL